MLRAADAFRITWSEPFVSDTRIHHLNALTEKAWEDVVQGLGNRESKLHVYGKRQTADSSRKFLKIENEQIKTAQNNSYNSNFRCRNNEQKKKTIKEETWSRGTNSRSPFDVSKHDA